MSSVPIIDFKPAEQVTHQTTDLNYDSASTYDEGYFEGFSENDTDNIPVIDAPRQVPSLGVRAGNRVTLNNPAVTMESASVTMESATAYMNDSTLQTVDDKPKVSV